MSKWKKWLKKHWYHKEEEDGFSTKRILLKNPNSIWLKYQDRCHIIRELIACRLGLFLLVVTWSVCPSQDIKPPFWISKEGEEWGEEEIVTEWVGQKQKRCMMGWGGGVGGYTIFSSSHSLPTNIFLYFKGGNASLNFGAQFWKWSEFGKAGYKGGRGNMTVFFLIHMFKLVTLLFSDDDLIV